MIRGVDDQSVLLQAVFSQEIGNAPHAFVNALRASQVVVHITIVLPTNQIFALQVGFGKCFVARLIVARIVSQQGWPINPRIRGRRSPSSLFFRRNIRTLALVLLVDVQGLRGAKGLRPTFTDVWTDFTDVGPLGTVRVGQWKQPFGLETVSSFRYTTFMERSSLFQAFTPLRHIGVGFYNHSDDLDWTWAASYFRTGQDQFGGSLSTYGGNGAAGRLTHLLWHEGAKVEDYLHVGAGYFLNAPPNERVRFRSIPEMSVGEFVIPTGVPLGTSGQPVPDVANGTPFFVDTGTIAGTSLTQTLGLEALWVRGPLSWQIEAMGCFVDTSSTGNAFLNGAYSQVGWFLTGEHRPQ